MKRRIQPTQEASVRRESMLSQDWVPFWTAIAALAAAGSALVAARYTLFTANLVRLQSQPNVVLYVAHDPERRSILILVVRNIGHAVARNIQFFPERPIPTEAFGIGEAEAPVAKTMIDGPLVEGILLLAPGESRTITWGQIGGLTRALAGKPLGVDLAYFDGARKLEGNTVLEVRSYWATDASTRPMESVARSLEKLATTVNRIEQAMRKES